MHLFTPLLTTRVQGMRPGLGRTVIEQHGGALDFGPGGRGIDLRFTLPAPKRLETGETSDSSIAT